MMKSIFGFGAIALVLLYLSACVPGEQKEICIGEEGGCRYGIRADVLTNRWAAISERWVAIRRRIANRGNMELMRSEAERCAEQWVDIDFAMIPTSHYVIAADNYFKGIDYVLDVLLDVKTSDEDLFRFVRKALEKYRQICIDDVHEGGRTWKDDRTKERVLRLLKSDYEENVIFFKRKIIPLLQRRNENT